jgi:hypothetical protein
MIYNYRKMRQRWPACRLAIERWVAYRVAMFTYKAWHPLVCSVVSRCKTEGIITEAQYYSLSATLDRTQTHCLLKKV